MVPKEANPLRDILLRSKVFRSLPIWRIPEREPGLPFYVGEDQVTVAEDLAVDTAAKMLGMVLSLVLFLVPIWVLSYLRTAKYRLVVATIFIVLFSALLNVVTSAKPHESFAATAG